MLQRIPRLRSLSLRAARGPYERAHVRAALAQEATYLGAEVPGRAGDENHEGLRRGVGRPYEIEVRGSRGRGIGGVRVTRPRPPDPEIPRFLSFSGPGHHATR